MSTPWLLSESTVVGAMCPLEMDAEFSVGQAVYARIDSPTAAFLIQRSISPDGAAHARRAFGVAPRLYPRDAAMLAITYSQAGKPEDSEGVLAMVKHSEVALESSDEAILRAAATTLHALAIDSAVPAIHQAEILYNLALLAERQQRPADALALCDLAKARNPTQEPTFQRLRSRIQAPSKPPLA